MATATPKPASNKGTSASGAKPTNKGTEPAKASPRAASPGAAAGKAGDAPTTPPTASSATAAKRSPLSWQLLAVGAVLIVGVNAAVFWFLRHPHASAQAPASREISLGAFEFQRPNRDKQLCHGSFSVRVTLAPTVSADQVRQLNHDQSPLQSVVEITLRRMRFSDLTEPRLMRFKSRLATALNDELGADAVSDVVINDFQLEAVDPNKDAPAADSGSPQ